MKRRATPPDPPDLSAPLEDAELDELERFLVSDATSDETLTLSALDGYLTALVIGPTTVMPSRWMPGVWGSGEDAAPEYESIEQAQHIMSLLLRHMNGIVAEFEADPGAFEPMLNLRPWRGRDYDCGEAWAMGFMQGVELARADWQRLYDTATMVEALRPLRLLGSDHVTREEEPLIETPGSREVLAHQIPQALVAIHEFWLPYRAMAHAESVAGTVHRSAPKVGRNDPCPCGSGAKFKKCCGAIATRH